MVDMAVRPTIKKLSDLTPDNKNANRGTERGASLLENSLREYGAGRSILVDRKGKIIAGNKTVEQAGQIGLDDVIVVQTDGTKIVAVQRTDLDLEKDPRAKALAIADNRVGQVSLEWDPAMLAELDKEIDLGKFWSDEELNELLSRECSVAIEDEPALLLDRAAELQKAWKTERGQIWEAQSQSLLGRTHRLMCGSCLEDKHALIAGGDIAAVITDPPYGVGIDYGDFKDELANVGELITPLMETIREYPVTLLTPGIPAMWFYPRPTWLLAWIHPAPTSSGPWGFNGINPILAYGKDPHLAGGKGRKPDHIVMVADREGVDGHPTPKPLKVWTWLIERGSIYAGDVIYDPFLGSGTTAVACESIGRVCYGMELEPKYVAVALQRLKDMGLTPRLAE